MVDAAINDPSTARIILQLFCQTSQMQRVRYVIRYTGTVTAGYKSAVGKSRHYWWYGFTLLGNVIKEKQITPLHTKKISFTFLLKYNIHLNYYVHQQGNKFMPFLCVVKSNIFWYKSQIYIWHIVTDNQRDSIATAFSVSSSKIVLSWKHRRLRSIETQVTLLVDRTWEHGRNNVSKTLQ